MSLGILALLALAQTGEPARTVNGAELGPAADFTVEGPATVCLRELVIRPKAGQSVQLAYSGIHHGALRLGLADGTSLEFTEGESFRDQRSAGQRQLWRQTGMELFALGLSAEGPRYQMEGRGTKTRWNSTPRGFVSGPALRGDRRDRAILAGATFEPPDKVQCDRRFEYGWGVILGEEALDSRSDKAGNGEEN